MTGGLHAYVAEALAIDTPDEVGTVAQLLAERLGGGAVLFYGSVLRTGALGDILDFYVLTHGARGSPLRRLGLRWLWPDISYYEIAVGRRVIRAKVATMPFATFERATAGTYLDTTVWTRFAQPSALVWVDSPTSRLRAVRAVSAAIVTAARFAAVLGPQQGSTRDYWLALLRETYRTEFRVEAPGREAQIVGHAPAHFDRVLPLAWDAAGIAHTRHGDTLVPAVGFALCRAVAERWMMRSAFGKFLNIARLIKAAFTFDGVARYGLYKIERHTGVRVQLTPWREQHPVLAAPAVLWRVLRATPS
ncbi:hypothetical protein [uncultured Sphingomonas sp.]|uniref:hypothetical protein n=1 Tax=uncultured Sphingomonas sp. TaxID=158754 RepID=UPI0035CA6B84